MIDFISPGEFRDKLDLDEDFHLIDTRMKEDFDEWHIDGAINFPYSEGKTLKADELNKLQASEGIDPEDQVVTVSAQGITSAFLGEKLEDKGFSDVKTIKGGLRAWSGVYDRVPIAVEKDDLMIIQLQRRAKRCLGYVVGSRQSGKAAVVDPSRYTKEFIDSATERGLKITLSLIPTSTRTISPAAGNWPISLASITTWEATWKKETPGSTTYP